MAEEVKKVNVNTATFQPQGIWHVRNENKMIDVRDGGSFGWAADYAGIINSTPHTSNNVICRVLQSPRGFNSLGDGMAAQWHAAWKAMFELHPKSITGLNKTLQPNWESTTWGGTGEEIHVPTGMTRSRSDISMSFTEKYGLVFTNMLEAYNRYFIMDEDTKHPGIAMLNPDGLHDGLMDFYTWTMIFIEPGRYLEQVNRAWLITNMAPSSMPDATAKRDKTSNNELLEFDVNFTGVAQIGWGVDALASKILKQMRATQADPHRTPAFLNGITADVISDTKGGHSTMTSGFQESMEKAKSTMVNMTD